MFARVIAALCGLICLSIAFGAGANVVAGSWLFAGTVLGALGVAALSFWFAVSAHSGVSNVRWTRSVRMAFIFGAISLLVGYVGPLILYPDNNLGPLIGIFGTGPAGFAIGALIGFIASLPDRDAPD